MRQIIYSVAALAIILLTAISAKSPEDLPAFEGKIVYDVRYLDKNTGEPINKIYPEKMTVSIKENNLKAEIKDPLGIFSLNYICNTETEDRKTSIRFLGKKYYSELGDRDTFFLYQNMPTENVHFLQGNNLIAKLRCKKALLEIQQQKNVSCYYTKALKLRNAYHNTPYAEIDGILMKFEIKYTDFDMEITAKKIIPKAIDKAEFSISDDYANQNQDKIKDLFHSLL